MKKKFSVPVLLIICLVSTCVFSIIGVFLINIIPSYIYVKIPPPDFDHEYSGLGWDVTTKSIYDGYQGLIRAYLLRQEARRYFSNEHSPQSISDYFDLELTKLGWVRTEDLGRCKIFMPEMSSLIDAYDPVRWAYQRESFQTDDFRSGDLICMAAIGSEEHSYLIIITSVKPSLFTQWLEWFSEIS